jgi:hypothetical protein
VNRRMHVPDRRFRRRVIIAAVVTVSVLAGAGAALASATDNWAFLRPAPIHTSAEVTPTATPTPTVDPRDALARTQLRVELLGARAVAASPAERATPELITALQTAIAEADTALAGTNTAVILAARTAVNTAQHAVEAAVASWNAAQAQAALDAQAAAAAAQQKQAAAEQKKQEAALKKQAAAELVKQAAAAAAAAAPVPQVAPQTAPAPVRVAAPPAEVAQVATPTDPALAARDANAWFTADLNGIGATGFTISPDWAAACKQADAGPLYIQGCARSDNASLIYMKPVTAEVAATETARGVVIHEYAHLLQYRLGYPAVIAATDLVFGVGHGLEYSADCMALALGATGTPGGYTNDCSGARGSIAAALVAGHLP